MSFLAPWFLLGGLAVAAPVLFHLIRRSARERMPFSSLLFLRPTPPRATRRRKLEHIILMLLRCLALLLLAAGFARPFFPKNNAAPPPANDEHQTVILLDTSASMRRAGLWPQARAVAVKYLEKAAPADRLAVVAFDQQPRTLVSFSDWSSWPVDQRPALARQRLETLDPGWRGTHLGLALTTAAEQFSDDDHSASAGLRDVILISDLQEGAKLDGLLGHDWPKGVRFVIERVDPKRRGNAGLEILDSATANSSDVHEVRVRVTNASDSDREKFQLTWEPKNSGFGAVGSLEIYLPPGQMRTFAAPKLSVDFTNALLRLSGDDEDFDNTAWFVPAETEHVRIAYFGAESANDPERPRYYLQRAFPGTSRQQIQVVATVSNSVFSSETLYGAALAVIPTSLDAGEAMAVRDWLAGGKTALMILTNAQAGATLGTLADLPDPEIAEVSGDYALLGEVDFTHPIFAPFADPRFSDFSHIHFWKHRRWTLPPSAPVRVLAKFDDGSPALAQIAVGKGTLLVLTSGWNPADSQLALSTKFLPLLQTILDWSGGAPPVRSQFQTGDVIPSPVSVGEALRWRKPDGKDASLAAGTPFTETELPGIYSVMAGEKLRRFAVNLPLDESRTAPMSPDDLARLGVPLESAAEVPMAKSAAIQRQLQAAELENHQKLWRWLIVGLLAVVLVEIVLGGWLARRVQPVEVTP